MTNIIYLVLQVGSLIKQIWIFTPTIWKYQIKRFKHIYLYIHCIYKLRFYPWTGCLHWNKIEYTTHVHVYKVRVMVINATFNNISAILWRSALLVEETGAGFQYFTSVPVLHYPQVVFFPLKFEHFSWISYAALFKIMGYQLPF